MAKRKAAARKATVSRKAARPARPKGRTLAAPTPAAPVIIPPAPASARRRVASPAASRTTARPGTTSARLTTASRVAPPRERVTGRAARALREEAARPEGVPRHSGDRRPSAAEVTAAQAVLNRARGNVANRPKVQATKMGFYDHKRRRKGDVFSLKDPKHFTRKWMVKVDAATPLRVTTGREELKRQHDEILGARFEGRSEVTESQEVQDEEVDNPLED